MDETSFENEESWFDKLITFTDLLYYKLQIDWC